MQNILSIESKVENLNKIVNWINEISKTNNLSEEFNAKIQLVTEEIFVNISSYAYKDKIGDVEIISDIKNNEMSLQFKDSGVLYNPIENNDADINSSIENRINGGFGLLLVKNNVDEISYKQENNQNVLSLKFYLNKSI